MGIFKDIVRDAAADGFILWIFKIMLILLFFTVVICYALSGDEQVRMECCFHKKIAVVENCRYILFTNSNFAQTDTVLTSSIHRDGFEMVVDVYPVCYDSASALSFAYRMKDYKTEKAKVEKIKALRKSDGNPIRVRSHEILVE